MQNIIDQLTGHPFFQSLPHDLYEALAPCASIMRYETDQVIYQEGDEADTFFLIRSGKVALELIAGQHGALVIQTIGAGYVLGWSWLFPPYRRRFDARAIQPTEAIVMEAICLRRKAEQDHRLGYELYKRFSKVVVTCLQATQLQLLDVYGRSAARHLVQSIC